MSIANSGGTSDSIEGSTKPNSNIRTTPGSSLHPATAALLGLSSKLPPGAKLAEPGSNEANDESAMVSGDKKTVACKVAKELPITPGALVNNLGIPLAVVVTKVRL